MPHAKEVVKCLHHFWRNLSLRLFPCSQYTLVIILRASTISAWDWQDATHIAAVGVKLAYTCPSSTRGRLTARSPVSANHFSAPEGWPTDGPMECGGLQTLLWPPKADVYADSSGSPQKTQSRPRKMRHRGRRLSGIPPLFALVLRFYREFSQLMGDCTGRQSAHKLRALKPHPPTSTLRLLFTVNICIRNQKPDHWSSHNLVKSK